MKVAISVDNSAGLDSTVAQHFGRCPFFVIANIDDQKVQAVEVIDNPFYQRHEPGQVPNFVHQQGAQVMLASGMGGRAIQFFAQLGVDVACGASGTAREALDAYLAGTLQGAAPCSESVEHGH